jgi:hypothetical protein
MVAKDSPNPSDRLPDWHLALLMNFVSAISRNGREMQRAHSESATEVLAWAVRNLLEIPIWVSYCDLSGAHARRFYGDGVRDGLHGIQAPDWAIEAASANTGMDIASKSAELRELAREEGFSGVDAPYTCVNDAARELNRLEELKLANH